MRSSLRLGFVVVAVTGWIAVAETPPAVACTSAVVAPEGSVTGTPLLWKNRDTPVLENKVVYVDEDPFDYLCLANAAADSGRSCWAGLNASGFAIMNTATYNVPVLDGEIHDRQGIIMADALRICRTVDDFERYLEANLGPELGGKANFGVMDADGGAALFEIHNHGIERMNAADQPKDYLVNTNYARTGSEGKGHGYLRFERAAELFDAFPEGGVDPEVILHRFSRDLDNPLIDEPSLADAASFTAGEPVWINSRDCIDRPLTASTAVFVGGVDGRPATMWIIPGEPVTAAAIPLWVEAGGSPTALHDGELAPMWQASRRIKDHIRPSTKGHTADYIDIAKLDNAEGTGYLPALLELETTIFSETEAFLTGGPTPEELGHFQEAMANRLLDHLETVEVPEAVTDDPDAAAAACDELVSAMELLAAGSPGIEVRVIGRSKNGEPLRVVEIAGGGPDEILSILLPCGLGVEPLDEAFDGLVDGLNLEDGEADSLDLVLVPSAEAMEIDR